MSAILILYKNAKCITEIWPTHKPTHSCTVLPKGLGFVGLVVFFFSLKEMLK